MVTVVRIDLQHDAVNCRALTLQSCNRCVSLSNPQQQSQVFVDALTIGDVNLNVCEGAPPRTYEKSPNGTRSTVPRTRSVDNP